MGKQQLVLHVGLHKSGTTSIQRGLIDHRDVLEAEGTVVPGRLGRTQPGHHLWVRVLRDRGVDAFLDGLAKYDNWDRVILSAENFLNLFLQDFSLSRDLAKRLYRAYDIRIIVFLRRQDYQVESVFAQRVKFENACLEPQTPVYPYDYKRVLEILERLFGRESISICIYRDDQSFDSWVALREQLRFSVNNAGTGVDRIRKNRSLHRRKVFLSSKVELTTRKAGVIFNRVLQESNSVIDDGERFLFPPDHRRALLERHLFGNEWICERYGLDCKWFYTASGFDFDWSPPVPISDLEWAGLARDFAHRLAKATVDDLDESG